MKRLFLLALPLILTARLSSTHKLLVPSPAPLSASSARGNW